MDATRWRRWLTLGLALLVAACAAAPGPTPVSTRPPAPLPTGDVIVEAAAKIAEQGGATGAWSGPASGPTRARQGVEIDFVAADQSNGGVMAVYAGVQRAVAAIGWGVVLRDGGGTADGRASALQAAIGAKPAAIVLGGFDASEHPDLVARARAAGIVLVGWHAGAVAGADPTSPLFTNVSTRPSDVALLAADYVINVSHGTAGVAIFTDSQYQIALDKANLMKAQIQRCSGCRVLAYRDVPILDSSGEMPSVVRDLRSQFGTSLTHLLAINGNYFAGSRLALIQDKVPPTDPPQAVAAGDGDQAEFDRIRNGDYQLASVAEPLYLQGWQLVDEVNRALANVGPSGYVAPPGLITRANVPAPTSVWDPTSAYHATFRRIWGIAP